MSDHASNDRDDLPRQVDLAIVRVDPWGVMKVAFLLSVALGIALVVAVMILWLMLNAMHVFARPDGDDRIIAVTRNPERDIDEEESEDAQAQDNSSQSNDETPVEDVASEHDDSQEVQE